jgi:hypothetical protein
VTVFAFYYEQDYPGPGIHANNNGILIGVNDSKFGGIGQPMHVGLNANVC